MIGDVLTSSVMFEALKNHLEGTEIHYLINSHTDDVIKNNTFIDKVIFFKPEFEKNYWKLFLFILKIRKSKYDVIIDVYGKLSSNIITLFSGAKTKVGYYKKYSSMLFTDSIKRLKQPKHNASLAIENRLKLLEPLQVPFNNLSPKIYLEQKEIIKAKSQLDSFSIDLTKPLYMISVLGSSPSKTYPKKYMAQLLEKIIETDSNSQLLFNYIPNQSEDAKEVYDLCSKETQSQLFFNLYGKNLREFLALTYHCQALIGNEGGAINMAKALQIPTFIIFSPHLNKANWYGSVENDKHVAVHLSDFVDYQKNDLEKAKENHKEYYLKFKPTFIEPKLIDFLRSLK